MTCVPLPRSQKLRPTTAFELLKSEYALVVTFVYGVSLVASPANSWSRVPFEPFFRVPQQCRDLVEFAFAALVTVAR